MDINTTIDGANATIALTGNLTVASAPDLEASLNSLPEDVTNVTLDLTDLEYVASAGLRIIVASEKSLREKGGSICLAHPNEEVMEILDITGLVDILEIKQ